MVNASFRRASRYGFEMVTPLFIAADDCALLSIENLRHPKRFRFYENLAVAKHSRFIGWWFNGETKPRRENAG
jgi:hypothetical protein